MSADLDSSPGDLDASAPDHVLPDNRRGARQLALQVLYWSSSSPGEAERALRELSEHSALSSPTQVFAAQLVEAVEAHRQELDDLIDQAASHWRRDRIARIDGIILRLAMADMFYCATPARIAIDQAIELAKAYSGEQAYAFVNGVLDAIVRRRGLAQ